ncbi:MAG: hypothetical protein WAU88_01325 [Candidatus Zixiibacteriota bacterium]
MMIQRRAIVLQALVVLLAATWSLAHAQGPGVGWDADDSLPPPVGAHGRVRPQGKLRPLHLFVYSDCDQDSNAVFAHTNQLRLVLSSPDWTPAFDSWSTDSSLEIRILSENQSDFGTSNAKPLVRRPTRQSRFDLPSSDFVLSVIQWPDTAKVRIVLKSSIEIEYTHKSSLLLIDSPRAIPGDLAWAQIGSQSEDAIKELLDGVGERFGRDCKLVTLKAGFYPCVLSSWVSTAYLGKRRSVNKTSTGFLVCYQVSNATRLEEFKAWIPKKLRETSERSTDRIELLGSN